MPARLDESFPKPRYHLHINQIRSSAGAQIALLCAAWAASRQAETAAHSGGTACSVREQVRLRIVSENIQECHADSDRWGAAVVAVTRLSGYGRHEETVMFAEPGLWRWGEERPKEESPSLTANAADSGTAGTLTRSCCSSL